MLCFTRGLSAFHNSKRQKGEEEAIPGPGTAVCAAPGMLQTYAPPCVPITLGSASQPPTAHLKFPGEAVSGLTVGKVGGEGQRLRTA